MIPQAEKSTLPLKTLNKELVKGNLLGSEKNFTKGMLCVDDDFRLLISPLYCLKIILEKL